MSNEGIPPLEHVFVRQVQPNLLAHRELAVQLLQTPVEVRELRGHIVFRSQRVSLKRLPHSGTSTSTVVENLSPKSQREWFREVVLGIPDRKSTRLNSSH